MCGSSPDVGVVGFSLSGGVSWFARRHGFAANQVVAVELVTPDGDQVCVDAQSDPELFWALRGGGGNFGIVTALSIRLIEAPALYGGLVAWPVERAAEVLRAWRRATKGATLESTLTASVLNVPPLEEIPEVIRGRALITVGLVHLGSEDEGRALLTPIYEAAGEPIMDLMRPLAVDEVGDVAMDPRDPLPYDMRGEMVHELTDAMLDGIVETTVRTPMIIAQIRHMGGAIARPCATHGAIGHVEGQYLVYGVGATPDAQLARVVDQLFGALHAAIAPQATGRRPLTFTHDAAEARAVYGEAYERLLAVKRLRDPDGIVRGGLPLEV
jgi:FAD/FMN-containing dehydrogenase